MARIRTIKPGFFTHEGLADLDPLHRLLFIGLWTEADREGRMEDRPRRLKATLLPYDDCDVDAMLNDLVSTGFVRRYQVSSMKYILIPSFLEHQRPHHKEENSSIPAPIANDEPSMVMHAASTPQASAVIESCETVVDAQEGNGREGKEGSMLGATAPAPPSPSVEELEAEWPKDLCLRTREAVASTRKSGGMSAGPWRAFLLKARAFVPHIRQSAAQEYLDRACAADGKGEAYLLGIMRGEFRRETGPPVFAKAIKAKADSQAAKEIAETKQRNAALAAIKPAAMPAGFKELLGKIGNGK